MKLYNERNEIRLRLGGCSCCSTDKQLVLDETNKVVPYNEDSFDYWGEIITIEDVNKMEQYLADQSEQLIHLKKLLQPK